MSETPAESRAAGAFGAAVASCWTIAAVGAAALMALEVAGAPNASAAATSPAAMRRLFTASLCFAIFITTAGIGIKNILARLTLLSRAKQERPTRELSSAKWN